MRLLLDTHLLLWATEDSDRLSRAARELLTDDGNDLLFSPISIWEVAIKHRQQRSDLDADPQLVMRALEAGDYKELPVTAAHTLAVANLPPIHKDPFDRLLLAQAQVEGVLLVTSDKTVAKYPGDVRKV